MEFNEYQQLAHHNSLETEIGGSTIAYAVMGLLEESGEVAGKIKKLYRDKQGITDPEFKEALVKEMGDVLWYLAGVAKELGISLGSVARENILKLQGRRERGTIHGDGDDR